MRLSYFLYVFKTYIFISRYITSNLFFFYKFIFFFFYKFIFFFFYNNWLIYFFFKKNNFFYNLFSIYIIFANTSQPSVLAPVTFIITRGSFALIKILFSLFLLFKRFVFGRISGRLLWF